MILKSLRIQWVDDQKGYGLFASQPIPSGTVTFVQDRFDICIDPSEISGLESHYRQLIDIYSYEDNAGRYILSWDHGKYMNHCCHANTLTTGFGFEIAVRDIEAGEEVTDDYRLFSTNHCARVHCGFENCSGEIDYSNLESLFPVWDKKVKNALQYFNQVQQPLLPYFDNTTTCKLKEYFQGTTSFPSSKSFLKTL